MGLHEEIVDLTYAEKTYRVRLVDTIGLWDTSLSEDKVLLELARLPVVCEGCIHQILFVTNDRFTKEEEAAFNIFQTVLLDPRALAYTTVVRTTFDEFDDANEVGKLKASLERLCPSTRGVKKILAVDNISKKSKHPGWQHRREQGRRYLLSHIFLNCSNPYRPPEMQEVKDKVEHFVNKDKKLEAKVHRLEKEIQDMRLAGEVHGRRYYAARAELRASEQERGNLQGKIVEEMRSNKKWEVALETVKTVGKVAYAVGAVASRCVIQ